MRFSNSYYVPGITLSARDIEVNNTHGSLLGQVHGLVFKRFSFVLWDLVIQWAGNPFTFSYAGP